MNYSEKLTRWMLEDTLTRYPAFDIQNAGFLICNGTKESIIKAIDNYLANNEKTINDLD